MEEPIKQLMDKLDEISNTCGSLLRLKNKVIYGGRVNSKTFQILEHIIELSNIRENKAERFKVAIIGTIGGDISKYSEIFRILTERNIGVEIFSFPTQEFSMGKFDTFTGTPSEVYGLDFGEGSSITSLTSTPPLRFLSREMYDFEPIQELFKNQDKVIPIKGKSSKKGKNNQFGSKFHK